MFKKVYVGHHGYTTWVRGVFRVINDQYHVLVTAVGRPDDEIVPGNLYSPQEMASITEGDCYAYAEAAVGLVLA